MIPPMLDIPVAAVPPRNDRMIALFLLGSVAFSPLLVRMFGVSATLFGCPLLFVFMFAAWAGLVLLIALGAERRPPDKPKRDKGSASA